MTPPSAIVVGSGVSGLAAAILLARNGRRVQVVEKSPRPGGCLRRFRRDGHDFDVGFHFTGGLRPGQMFRNILEMLDIAVPEVLETRPLRVSHHLEYRNRTLRLPPGLEPLRDALKDAFPADRPGIEAFFRRFRETFDRLGFSDLNRLLSSSYLDLLLEEDEITLQEMLDRHLRDPDLKAVLSGISFCYGVPPRDFSFAHYVRVAGYFFDGLVTFPRGGDSLFEALIGKCRELGIAFRTGVEPVSFEGVEGRTARVLRLDTGEAIDFDECVLTIDPRALLKIVPPEHYSPAFRNRILDFESTHGFFCVYGTGERLGDAALDDELWLLYPRCDLDVLLRPSPAQPGVLCFVPFSESGGRGKETVFSAMESMFFDAVRPFADSTIGRRGPEYAVFKNNCTRRILSRIAASPPGNRYRLNPVCEASPLTFRDYLYVPEGSAYGIQQRIGQHALLGRIRIRNIFMAGQNAFLPGILGSLWSSVLVARQILGDRLQFDE
jgi:all-trans-retinol 13,14-reductase